MNKDHIINLSKVTANHLSSLFGKDFSPSDDVSPARVPSFKEKYLAQIAIRNNEFQVTLIFGFPDRSCREILADILTIAKDESERIELAKSALGELANTIACDLAVDQAMVKDYGKLQPTPPLVWVIESNLPDFMEAGGFCGKLLAGKSIVYTFISVLSARDHPKVKDLQHWSPTKTLSIYDPNHSTSRG